MNILDLSGYMFTGKAAIHDFISEIDGFETPGNRVEFDLLRVKDGLADLESAVMSWSPIRADAAARRFLAVAERMSGGHTLLSRLTHPGFGYEARYPNFLEKSKRFIDDLTVESWNMYWPYQLIEMSRLETIWFKICRKFFNRQENIKYRLISPEYFYENIRFYLQSILVSSLRNINNHTLVLNNSFEPFDPNRFLSYFNNAKSIIIDRDPRDIFVFANLHSAGFNDKGDLYRRIAGAFDVNVFISRLKVYRSSTNGEVSDRVLRIKFEDLVLDYTKTSEVIYKFLNIHPSLHVRKLQSFDPEKSLVNVGLWRKYVDQKSIRLIEEAFLKHE